MRWRIAMAMAAALVAAGCSGEDSPALTGGGPKADAGQDVYSNVCDPGKQVDCACVGGGSGAQRCRDDGSGWESCSCPDASVDAPSDVASEAMGEDAAIDVPTEASEASTEAGFDASLDAAGCDAGQTQNCCGGTVVTCSGGVWPTCPAPPGESCNGLDDDCSGVADDHLPAPYRADEDVSGIDDCVHAYTAAFITPIYEGASPKSFSFNLAKEDGGEDRDFFSFTTFDTTDVECASNVYECFWMRVKLEEPSGTDLEMCLYELGNVGVPISCSTYEAKTCSGEGGNPANELTLPRQGGCGVFDDDGRRYVLEVFTVQGAVQSCEAYTFTLELDAAAPQMEPCGF